MAANRIDNTPDKQALKGACRRLVDASGGVEAAENYCRAGFRRLSEYGRPDNDCFMPVDVVADLEAITHGTAGYPQVTRFLARRAGFALVALPAPREIASGNVHAALAGASTESSDVINGVLAALQSGGIAPVRARHLMRECVEAAESFMQFHALLEQIAGDA